MIVDDFFEEKKIRSMVIKVLLVYSCCILEYICVLINCYSKFYVI